MNVVFNSEFLREIRKTGNTIILKKFYLEEYNDEVPCTFDDILSDDPQRYNRRRLYGEDSRDKNKVTGIWDSDVKVFRTNILSLPSRFIVNKVDSSREYLEIHKGKYGNDLVKIIRFVYDQGKEKTAFILTGDISGMKPNYKIEPIYLDQSRNIFNIPFPNYTKANIEVSKFYENIDFIESYGLDLGINIFKEGPEKCLVPKDSYYKYLRLNTENLESQYPNIYGQGSEDYIYRDYIGIDIDCPGLRKDITPNTRIGLSTSSSGGKITVYGNVLYDEYLITGGEAIKLRSGEEAIEGIQDIELEFIDNNIDAVLDNERTTTLDIYRNNTEVNKFRISYKKSTKPDPSVKVKFNLKFYNPIIDDIVEINSRIIKLTQSTVAYTEWEITRGTEYTEEQYPVYLFSHNQGDIKTFSIKSSLSLSPENDFIIENPYEDRFNINIRKESIGSPYYRYTVTIKTLTNNDEENWIPGDPISLITLRTTNYSESFYVAQSPITETLELYNSAQELIDEIILENNNEGENYYYPQGVLGNRNYWKVLEVGNENIQILEGYGKIGESRLVLKVPFQSQTPETFDLGKIILGRIRENETIVNSSWRSIIELGKIEIPIKKKGIPEVLDVPDNLILQNIDVYKVNVKSNKPFACRLNYFDGFSENNFCFYGDSDRFYSDRFDYNNGIDVNIYLKNLTIDPENITQVGNIEIACLEELSWDFETQKTIEIHQNKCDHEINYLENSDNRLFIDLGNYSLKFKSTRTPEINYSSLLESTVSQPLIFERSIPEFEETYICHSLDLRNPRSPRRFYPISESDLFRISPSGYSDLYKDFLIYRKGIAPEINTSSNTVYLPSTQISESVNLVINSIYSINENDFKADGEFEITSIQETTTSERNYRYKYTITLQPLADNLGEQKNIGSLIITSKIYKENFITEYNNYTQEEVNNIIQPFVVSISVIQRGSSGGSDVEVSGNRGEVGLEEENRRFTITPASSNLPVISNLNGCTVNSISTEGFNISIPGRFNQYTPVIPSSTSDYTRYSQDYSVSFDVSIDSYLESFELSQRSIQKGLVLGIQGDSPKLYLGTNNIITKTISNTTENFNIFLGIFNINSAVSLMSKGTTEGITIDSTYPNTCINTKPTYIDTEFEDNYLLKFPKNETRNPITRVFTINYRNEHKIILKLHQLPNGSMVYCDDSIKIKSTGETLEDFIIETDIPERNINLMCPGFSERPIIIPLGNNKYKASIKFYTNTENNIKDHIIKILNNDTLVKNVVAKQGYYSFKVLMNDSYFTSHLGTFDNPVEVGNRSQFSFKVDTCEPNNISWTTSTIIPKIISITDFSWVPYDKFSRYESSITSPGIIEHVYDLINQQSLTFRVDLNLQSGVYKFPFSFYLKTQA